MKGELAYMTRGTSSFQQGTSLLNTLDIITPVTQYLRPRPPRPLPNPPPPPLIYPPLPPKVYCLYSIDLYMSTWYENKIR